MEQNKKIGYKDIFKQKEYMKMMVAALINRFGDSIDAIASTWIVYELTGSAVWSAVDVASYDVYHIDSGSIQGTSGQRIDTAGIAGRIL